MIVREWTLPLEVREAVQHLEQDQQLVLVMLDERGFVRCELLVKCEPWPVKEH